jgi:hypothetical protein
MVTDLTFCTVDGGRVVADLVMGSRKWLVQDYDLKTAAERVAERRERLIDACHELFGERGYASTSIRSVLQQSMSLGDSDTRRDSTLSAVSSP